MGLTENPQYIEGQEVIVNLKSNIDPAWLKATVTDSSPRRSRVGRLIDKAFGLKPVTVTIDQNAEELPGAEVTIYSSGNKGIIQPRS
ncbi:MAG: hypothetical protein UT24_C0012G0017 [Candidatus Woesebacteria bacterium GW2011_GWB1_39_12]|uniref:Uncharacterized protein n=2 Tax=Candidatus Woeseibacteriota TaxID=1752722 RepID=A0A0G0LZI9_9BACT|nr:MAG: hypothetical protein UT23_C0013G0023 [Candidatus Woesebacteria bacterium GW2011_GWA1_39_12]KKR00395.1 MAG: hypothetical protein UT24_C0012G0017 [Candidatus Woesebacteria bacterium GW2011_GWB1_39_12]